jgi:TolB-like protein
MWWVNNMRFAMASMCVVMVAAAAAHAADKKTPAVAILPFKVLNAEPQFQHFGEGASDAIINKMINDKALKIVEESQLDKAVNALSRNQQGLFEEESALTIGQMVDARFIVMGSVQVVGDATSGQIKVNARVLEIETRQLFMSEALYGPISTAFQQYDELAARLTSKLTAYLAQRVTSGESADEMAVRQLIEEGKAFDPAFPAVATVQKDLARAAAAYNKALLRSPKSARANLAMGHAELRLGEASQGEPGKAKQWFTQAREHLRAATTTDSAMAFSWNQLGRAEGFLQNHAAAKSAFEKALAIDPSLTSARFGLAVALYNAGSYNDARVAALAAAASGEPRGKELAAQIDARKDKK